MNWWSVLGFVGFCVSMWAINKLARGSNAKDKD